jgi:ferredoxin
LSRQIYHQLARHLDDLPCGYPATESGVELRILERLFTPEEARLASVLTVIAEEPRVVARRAGISVARAERLLSKMARKGLILDDVRQGQPVRYMAAHFAIGIWELQVDKLNLELIQDMEEYKDAFIGEGWAKVPQLRTVPVTASLDGAAMVLPHEKALELIERHTKFLVAPCICRQERTMAGVGCSKPEHYCLLFGTGAELFHRNRVGRFIDKEEMAALIRQADDHGLVLQPSNSKKMVNICCCCGCCCGVLTTFKKYPRPGEMVHSAFVTAYDPEACMGCGTCVERCPMEALGLTGDTAAFKQERCIGCGLCTTTCPYDALTLTRRPDREQPDVPATFEMALVRLARERGKLGIGRIAATLVKSKLDRLLAPRSK